MTWVFLSDSIVLEIHNKLLFHCDALFSVLKSHKMSEVISKHVQYSGCMMLQFEIILVYQKFLKLKIT